MSETHPFNLIRQRNARGHWPHTFRLNGREYTLTPDGSLTFGADARGEFLRVRVFGKPPREVTIREGHRVEVVSWYSYGAGREFDSEGRVIS